AFLGREVAGAGDVVGLKRRSVNRGWPGLARRKQTDREVLLRPHVKQNWVAQSLRVFRNRDGSASAKGHLMIRPRNQSRSVFRQPHFLQIRLLQTNEDRVQPNRARAESIRQPDTN